MAVSMRDLDPAFANAGQKAGIEIWKIENSRSIPLLSSSYGKFFVGDCYLILKTSLLKGGTLRHDIHYWIGKSSSKDYARTAASKSVELDATLGGRAVQYREIQGNETDKFLSYFKPCIIPLEGGISFGVGNTAATGYKTRLYVCKGKHIARVEEVSFARSSLNHDDVFILDTEVKIFQFNGSNSKDQERAKALEVVQYIKDTYHDKKCEIASVDDGKMLSNAETGEFWAFFGGFAPLPRRIVGNHDSDYNPRPRALFCIGRNEPVPVKADQITRKLLETDKCYIIESGINIFVWVGRNTSLDERKISSQVAEEFVVSSDGCKSHLFFVIEGFEMVMFKSVFDSWPQTADSSISEDGRGKVAALLKRQGVDVKGLLKTAPAKEEPQSYIDHTGNLQVWLVNDDEKILISCTDHTKFYCGDCYIFQYSYMGEDKEEFLVGTWFGKQSISEDRASALSLARKMIESLKYLPVQARIYEGNEPIQFLVILQNLIIFKGGLSSRFRNVVSSDNVPDETYNADGVALFRVQGTGADNMQAIQVNAAASSLNSSYCYILHSGSMVFTWFGNLASPEDHELAERQLDLIKPNLQSKAQKEGSELESFWELLGGKSEYPTQKIVRDAESDPHLFLCTFSKGDLKVMEIYSFSQDDLMTEDVFLLDCHSEIFVWIGQLVGPKNKELALTIGEKYLECDFLLENISRETSVYVVMEGSEPSFFTRFFTWDSAKSSMHGSSFQRRFAIVKSGRTALPDKPKRRTPVSYTGRSGIPDKSQRSRSVSFSPDRVRVRGRSPAFNALAANFENQNPRNLSTPPPIMRKIYPKSVAPVSDSVKLTTRSNAIAELTASFEKPALIPRSVKVVREPISAKIPQTDSMSTRIEALSIKEDVKEGEADDEERLPVCPYNRLIVGSANAVSDIDVTKREAYLSAEEFQHKFEMPKSAFYKLPKWKQNKLKMALHLF